MENHKEELLPYVKLDLCRKCSRFYEEPYYHSMGGSNHLSGVSYLCKSTEHFGNATSAHGFRKDYRIGMRLQGYHQGGKNTTVERIPEDCGYKLEYILMKRR